MSLMRSVLAYCKKNQITMEPEGYDCYGFRLPSHKVFANECSGRILSDVSDMGAREIISDLTIFDRGRDA